MRGAWISSSPAAVVTRPRLGHAVAHYQSVPGLVVMISVLDNVLIHLGPQCRKQHPPGALADQPPLWTASQPSGFNNQEGTPRSQPDPDPQLPIISLAAHIPPLSTTTDAR